MNSDYIISLISKIREKANKFLINEMKARDIKSLVSSHGDIIFSLFKESKLTMKELTQKTGKDKSTVTALVDKLIKLGYVGKIKSSEDARNTFILLTEKGALLKPDLNEIFEKLLTTVYKGITEQEKVILINILSKIRNNLY